MMAQLRDDIIHENMELRAVNAMLAHRIQGLNAVLSVLREELARAAQRQQQEKEQDNGKAD